jgi:hypothetical protein
MLGSTTAPDRSSARAGAVLRVAFRPLSDVGIRNVITWLNTQPAGSLANASTRASRPAPHGSGPVWFATPSLRGTPTHHSLPVSRRTQSDGVDP